MGRLLKSVEEFGRLRTGERGASRAPLGRLSIAMLIGLLATNCTIGPSARVVDPQYGVAASPRVVEDGQPIPKGGGVYRVGNPYTIAGRTYVPQADPQYQAEGIASWYGSDFHGRRTANGEIYDMHALSAAHPTLPIPSYVRVTNLANRRSLVVRVNDRGPFKHDRVIDLSSKTAELLGFRGNGLARVRVEYVGRASLDGSDDRKLMATLRTDGQLAPAPSAVLVASTAGPFVPVAAAPLPSGRAAQIPSPQGRPFETARFPASTVGVEARAAAIRQSAAAPMEARPSFTQRADTPGIVPVLAPGPAVVSGRGLY